MTVYHPVARRRVYGPHLSVFNFLLAYDSVSVSDFEQISKIGKTRTTLDSFSISDLTHREFPRTSQDLFTITDAAARTNYSPVRLGSGDALAVSDSVSRSLGGARTASDSVSVSDVSTRTNPSARNTNDSITFSDDGNPFANHRYAFDTVRISDLPTEGVGRRTSDSFSFSDSATWAWAYFRYGVSFTESANPIGTLLAQPGRLWVGSIATSQNFESWSVADTRLVVGLSPARASDSFSISDQLSKIYRLQISDSFSVSDSASVGSVLHLYGSQIGLYTAQPGYIFQVGNQK